ncbi:MAG: NTP transferase domain-containing protein [Candidatus Pacebacteria bacterium]|jgi:UTP--glucose-1-phosphate uridylyltransferase|nr:NTP transferase domain-containing protein [Candidatus Paceibacterota bacterium]MBT4652243.1 NTP transferase domain-containing protein [Candidatus Paceibacterota bacterium]MBT6756655.1 NTP transferase domain-containing protein [Candidatus Paceibacterota bacterium]MBT6921429.1 NTP transferase domain-containing protein [Candidatus Paceibacterota bacterium]
MKIKKALIAAAGFGTRFLPVTKTIQKEMIPVLNKPVVDYLVDDLVKAGITEIVFVINEHNKQILHYFRENYRLKEYLEKMNKAHLYEEVKKLHEKANFSFVKQTESDPYGSATPVKLAQSHFENEEAFVVLMGDDIPYNADGTSEVSLMLQHLEKTGAPALATFTEQPTDLLHKYGIAETIEKNGFQYLKNLIEKPEPGSAPSNLANISKYILTPDVFDIIDNQKIDSRSGELYITDTVTKLAQQKDVAVYTPRGTYLDCGYLLGWLKANLTIAKEDPSLYPELKKILQEINF